MEEYNIEDIDDYEIIIGLIMSTLIRDYNNYNIEEVKGIRKFLIGEVKRDTIIKIAQDLDINIEKK